MERRFAKRPAELCRCFAETRKKQKLPYLDFLHFLQTNRSSIEPDFLERAERHLGPDVEAIMSAKLQHAVTTSDAIDEFHVNVPESELTELRRRINATKWPERETVADASAITHIAILKGMNFFNHKTPLALRLLDFLSQIVVSPHNQPGLWKGPKTHPAIRIAPAPDESSKTPRSSAD
jgi:hypothetical protein